MINVDRIVLTERAKAFLIYNLPREKHEEQFSREKMSRLLPEPWDTYDSLCGGIDTSKAITNKPIPFMCFGCGSVWGKVTVIAPIHECPNCEGKLQHANPLYFVQANSWMHNEVYYPSDITDLITMMFVWWALNKVDEYTALRKRIIGVRKDNALANALFGIPEPTPVAEPSNAMKNLFI